MATKRKTNEDHTGQREQKLSAEQLGDVAEELATELELKEELQAKKATHVKKWNEQVRIHDSNIRRLRISLKTGVAWVDAQEAIPFPDHDPDTGEVRESAAPDADDPTPPKKKRARKPRAEAAEATA